MTNPNDAVGTNAAFGGRTSVNAFNDLASCFNRGIVNGWACVPNSGLTVSLGGDGTNRDVAIAIDNAGNRTTINNISQSPIDITLDAAPASNSRIDAIVAYVDNPANGVSTVADNPSACGLIAVKGVVSATPTPPNESAIRTAITADGASGTTAYYVVLANITVVNGTTDITSGDISQDVMITLPQNEIIKSNNIDFATFPTSSVTVVSQDNKTSYDEVIDCSRFSPGQKFLVLATGYININGGTNYGYYIDIRYNNTNISGSVWANNLTGSNSSVPSCAGGVATKVEGEDSITVEFRRSNATLREIRFHVMVIPLSN